MKTFNSLRKHRFQSMIMYIYMYILLKTNVVECIFSAAICI